MPKISELPSVASPTTDDTIPLVDSGTTSKATLGSLPISTATQTALDTKANLSGAAFTGAISAQADGSAIAVTMVGRAADDIALIRGVNNGFTVESGRIQIEPNAIVFAQGASNTERARITAAGLTLATDLAVTEGGTGASTAAGARTNLGAAASGANSDITSLSAVTSYNGGQLAGMRNKIINGKMEIAQRGTSFAAISAGAYSVDRWAYNANSTTAVLTASQQADVPSSNEFQNSLRFTVTTADAAIAAGDASLISQVIEGYNARDLIGRPITISFWVRSSVTGIHCISLRNSGVDRSYVAEYTVNVANTWEYKTVVVSGGLTTAGTWNWTNGWGVQLSFTLAAGTTYQTTANAWQAGNFLATSNQVNCLATIGNIFAITGVQFEVGSVATAFEHRIYGAELALCQRYCLSTTGTNGTARGSSATSVLAYIPTPVTMRTTPSISSASVAALTRYDSTAISVAGVSFTVNSIGPSVVSATINNTGALTDNALYWYGALSATLSADF